LDAGWDAAAFLAHALQDFDTEGKIRQAHAHGFEQGQIRVIRPLRLRRHQLGERPDARPIAVTEALAEFGAERPHRLDHVDRDQIDPVEHVLREFLALGRDRAHRIEVCAFRQHARRDDRFARAGDRSHDGRVLQRVFDGRGFDKRDRREQFLQLADEGAAVLRRRTEDADALELAHGSDRNHLGQRLLAGTDHGKLVGGLRGHARSGDAGDPAGAHLPERERLDDGLQLARVAVPQCHQRRRPTRGMRPRFRPDNVRAFDHRADGVQRVMTAPDLMRLGHVARGTRGLQRQPRLQRLDRFGQRERGDDVLLGDPERFGHVLASEKMEATGGARSSAFTM
jgi:hypothetical protein